MATKKTPAKRSTLGNISALRGRFAAKYMQDGRYHTPGRMFDTFQLADQWLLDEQRLIDRDEWTPPDARRQTAEISALTFGQYSDEWITRRMKAGQPLKARTTEHYRYLRAQWLAPMLQRPLAAITRAEASRWYYGLPADKHTVRQHAYALARSIMRSAMKDGLIDTNPVDVEGAGAHTRPAEVDLFTPAEVARLAALMPPQHELLVLLAAWCGLRFGELAGLLRHDFETDAAGVMRVHVRRAVVTVNNTRRLETPKTNAGYRVVVVPPHLVPVVKHHLATFAQWGRDGLVFPSSHAGKDYLTPGQVYGSKPTYDAKGKVKKAGSGYYGARHELGRDDLSFHKLRHFAGTTYAIAGATDREIMAMMGHSDVATTMRYQHAARSRAEELAGRLAEVAGATGGAL